MLDSTVKELVIASPTLWGCDERVDLIQTKHFALLLGIGRPTPPRVSSWWRPGELRGQIIMEKGRIPRGRGFGVGLLNLMRFPQFLKKQG